MQSELRGCDDESGQVDAFWLPSIDALEAGLARLHQQLGRLDRELRQARSDYRQLIELGRAPGRFRLPQFTVLERLSPQERRVATLAASGRTNAEVAAELHVTVHTVKSQMASILQKLDLRSRWELDHFLRRDDVQRPTSATARATPMT